MDDFLPYAANNDKPIIGSVFAPIRKDFLLFFLNETQSYLRRYYSQKIELIPYTQEHVPLVHSWMNDPTLNELTCTEPSSLNEEYESQKELETSTNRFKKLIKLKDSSKLVGDIDLFFHNGEEVEINIMIAIDTFRKQGIASEALKLSLSYIINHFNDENIIFMAKISSKNIESISFFRKHKFSTSQESPDHWGNYTFCLAASDMELSQSFEVKDNKVSFPMLDKK